MPRVVRGDARPVVGDLDHAHGGPVRHRPPGADPAGPVRAAGLPAGPGGAHPDDDPAAGRGVRTRVGQEVAQDLGELVAVAERLDDVEVLLPVVFSGTGTGTGFGTGAGAGAGPGAAERLEPDVPVRVAYGGARDGVRAQGEQVDALAAAHGRVTELGEQEEVVDQAAHAVGVVHDPAVRLPAPPAGHPGLVDEQLGETLDRRERSAQFVTRVRHEPPHAPLRVLGPVQGAAEPVEHRVERQTQAPHLRVGVGHRHVQLQVARGDVLGGALHPGERTQAEADGGVAQQHHAARGQRAESDTEPEQLGRRAVHGVERQRHHRPHLSGPRTREHPPVGAVAAVGRHRGGPAVGQLQVGRPVGQGRSGGTGTSERVLEQVAPRAVEEDTVVGGQYVGGPVAEAAVGQVLVHPGRRPEPGEPVVDLVGQPGPQDHQAGELAEGDRTGGQEPGDQHETAAQRARTQPARTAHGATAPASSGGSRRQ
ncbi:hypothetical protein TPA0905_58550 [Streptomyces olivaceus]|nr:hypothetical protein TPA0905_58550 [Streptomyces olivaceus]